MDIYTNTALGPPRGPITYSLGWCRMADLRGFHLIRLVK